MNKEIKEAKKKRLEAKFRNQEELAKAKAALIKSQKELERKAKNARLEEQKLRLQLKKEQREERHKLAKEKRQFELNVKKEKQLILENKKNLAAEKAKVRQELALKRQEQKNELLKTKTANSAKLANLKSEIAHEKNLRRKELAQTKEETRIKLAKTQEEILRAREEAIRFKLESEKLIHTKREEVELQKKDFETKLISLKDKAEKDRAARITANLKAQQELREIELKAIAKHKNKILELKGKAVAEDSDEIAIDRRFKSEVVGAKEALAKQKQQHEEDKLELKVIDLNNQEQILEAKVERKKPALEDHVSGVTVEIKTTDFVPHIEDEVLKGKIVEEVGKVGLKLFEQANKDETKLSINKLKLPANIIDTIKLIQELKDQKDLIDIREFGKYISYLVQKEVSHDELDKYIASTVASILRGKTFSFIGGYFRAIKVKGYTFIVFEDKLTVSKGTLISLPNSEFTSTLEKMVIDKLNRGAVIQISNNIAIRVAEGTIQVLNDLPLLEI